MNSKASYIVTKAPKEIKTYKHKSYDILPKTVSTTD